MVTNVRSPLVEVQLPAGLTGPDGIRQFWAKREDLTDARVPEGCRFGR